jgi:hypothetical protein
VHGRCAGEFDAGCVCDGGVILFCHPEHALVILSAAKDLLLLGFLDSAAEHSTRFAGVSLSLACPRESNQRERHPGPCALRASCPPSTRLCSGSFRQYIRVLAKRWPTSCRPPFGLFLRTVAATQRRVTADRPVGRRARCTPFFAGAWTHHRKIPSTRANPSCWLLLCFSLLRHKASRAPEAKAGARPACLSTWMCEFGPARRPREAQGTDAASSHRRVSGANGFGYFCQNKSDTREARKLCT